MKIRTDFVTNSSSSSFVVRLAVELKNGQTIDFLEAANGGEAEGFDSLYVTVSPKQLAMADTVSSLIRLLKENVTDGGPCGSCFGDAEEVEEAEESNEFEEPEEGCAHIFDEADSCTKARLKDEKHWEHKEYVNANKFINKLSQIRNMADVVKVRITGDRTNNELREYVNYEYNKVTGEYTGAVFGYYDEGFYCNGSGGGKIDFRYDGVKMKRIKDPADLPETRGLGLYDLGSQKDFDWREWDDEDTDDIPYDAMVAPYDIQLQNTKKSDRKARSETVKVGDEITFEFDSTRERIYACTEKGDVGDISAYNWISAILKNGISYRAKVIEAVSYSQLENKRCQPIIRVQIQIEMTNMELMLLLGAWNLPMGCG